jgi:hypothetical protein
MRDDHLRTRFDAELLVAGLTLTGADYENLFEMWAEHLPERERLRAVVLAPEEAPGPESELEPGPWR